MSDRRELSTLGAGCFWCVEAIFQNLKGVESAISGYSGGARENPTYEQVCGGTTGHAEVVQVVFDPEVISYEELLYVFWRTHDPTTLNRQGGDTGTQYRSAIFYHDDEQRGMAEKSKEEADGADLWADPIVTEIGPFTRFYPAEDYHMDFFQQNPNQPYCHAVIDPKMRKFRKEFGEMLKNSGS